MLARCLCATIRICLSRDLTKPHLTNVLCFVENCAPHALVSSSYSDNLLITKLLIHVAFAGYMTGRVSINNYVTRSLEI